MNRWDEICAERPIHRCVDCGFNPCECYGCPDCGALEYEDCECHPNPFEYSVDDLPRQMQLALIGTDYEQYDYLGRDEIMTAYCKHVEGSWPKIRAALNLLDAEEREA